VDKVLLATVRKKGREKMTKLYKIVFAAWTVLGVAAWPFESNAGSVANVTIISVNPTSLPGTNGATPFFLRISVDDANIGCNSQNLPVFAIDETTAAGRAMIATALSAQATGQTVSIGGTGNCGVYGIVETANGVSIP
jgi:hypothetical protein